jgi:hypothetical protein
MNAATRLGLFAVGVVLAFAGAYGISALVAPDDVAAAVDDVATQVDEEPAMKGHTSTASTSAGSPVPGLSLSADGFVLGPVTAPTAVGRAGELRFQILTNTGEPVTAFAESHEKDLHLITVRSDGEQFRHVHPVLDAGSGTWSMPWEWDAAGTYRIYADFAPDVADAPAKVVLTRTVDVAGDVTPVPVTQTKAAAEVDGFEVALDGDLVVGASSELTVTVTRDGEPVSALQPYLGAFGHLVALRHGDLAYLHVHAEGDEPEAGDTSGPSVSFMAEPPTTGLYLLYLDFQVDGKVHTAEFVVDAKGTTHD